MSAKKTIAALIAVLSIGMTFSACGSSESSEEKTTIPEITIEPISIEPFSVETFTIEPISVELTTTQKVTTQKPAEAPAVPFTRGTVSGNTYTSTFANFKFTAPNGWSYMSDEDILEYVGYDDDMELYINSEIVFYDSIALKDETGDYLGFYFINLEKSGETAVAAKDAVEATYSMAVGSDDYTDLTGVKSFTAGNETFYYFTVQSKETGVYNTWAGKRAGNYMFYMNHVSKENDFESIIPYFTTKSGSPQSSNAIRMNGGMLEVDSSLFGMSKASVEAKLGVSLGAPENFPWWDVHQTLYYLDKNGYTFILLFNDNDELDVIYVDEDKEFDNAILDRYKAKYGEPETNGEEYNFTIGDKYHCDLYTVEYSNTGKNYFRQMYVNDNYWY